MKERWGIMLKSTLKILAVTIILAGVYVVFISADTATEIKEKNRTVAEYYKTAMESYYKGEYTAAISQWEEVLKIDAQQAQAKKLIEMARKKMSEKMKPLDKEVDKLIRRGKYKKAFSKSKSLLALDPTNKIWKKRNSRLETISKIAPELIGKKKYSRMMKKSISAHLAKKEKARVALQAARYAWQLNSKSKTAGKLKEYMESEYNVLAESERMISDMNIVKQKLQATLSHIYDGKYDQAILECKDVLVLEPNNLKALKLAGSSYYGSGNKKKAKQLWKRAYKINPKDKELRRFLKIKK